MLVHVGERARPVTFEGGVNELVNALKTVFADVVHKQADIVLQV